MLGPMKKALVLLATFLAPMANAGVMAFEFLAPRHVMPSDVKATLRSLAAEAITDCQRQLGSTIEQTDDYFTAVPIELAPHRSNAVLVLPTLDCYAFHGAHAIKFWVFLLTPVPSLVLSGAQDAMEVQKSSSNGLLDIITYYGTETTEYRYDGKTYVEHKRKRSE